jgi:hypothetical protein
VKQQSCERPASFDCFLLQFFVMAFIRADQPEIDFYTASDNTLRINERFPDNLGGITLLCLEQVNFDE